MHSKHDLQVSAYLILLLSIATVTVCSSPFRVVGAYLLPPLLPPLPPQLPLYTIQANVTRMIAL
jgi:hypothetical protein